MRRVRTFFFFSFFFFTYPCKLECAFVVVSYPTYWPVGINIFDLYCVYVGDEFNIRLLLRAKYNTSGITFIEFLLFYLIHVNLSVCLLLFRILRIGPLA